MLLPNAEFAIVPIEKLLFYCLNFDHPKGKHKAKVFESALGITVNNAHFLRELILDACLTHPAVKAKSDLYGQRYVLDFPMKGKERRVWIRTSWVVRRNEFFTETYELLRSPILL